MSAAREIEQLAAEWLRRSEEPDWSSDQQAELASWLDQSPAHQAAYWRLEHGWRAADRLAVLRNPQAESGYLAQRPNRWAWPIAASLALALGSYGWLQRPSPAEQAEVTQIATDVGVRKVVNLGDGSLIDLNTSSSIRAAIDDERRVVWLDKGEAYFNVAKRKGQEFIVHAGTKTITVLGTRFAVRRDGEKVSVVVEEGRVRVEDSAATGSARSTVIEGGDFAVARGPSTLITNAGPQKVEDALAWRAGMLSFDQRPLSEVAAEFNRYNQKQLVIGDAKTGAIRIGGTFKSDNVDAFVRLLRDAYGLNVQDDGSTVKISE